MIANLLRPNQIADYETRLKPLFMSALTANGAVKEEQAESEADWMLLQAQLDRVAVFVVENESQVTYTMAFQFSVSRDVKSVEILAMAGRGMVEFARSVGWQMILEWLRLNGVEYVEIRTSERLARVLEKAAKFKPAAVVSKLEL